jgi:hypothetical protein
MKPGPDIIFSAHEGVSGDLVNGPQIRVPNGMKHHNNTMNIKWCCPHFTGFIHHFSSLLRKQFLIFCHWLIADWRFALL